VGIEPDVCLPGLKPTKYRRAAGDKLLKPEDIGVEARQLCDIVGENVQIAEFSHRIFPGQCTTLSFALFPASHPAVA
jgi:hypothetical protein